MHVVNDEIYKYAALITKSIVRVLFCGAESCGGMTETTVDILCVWVGAGARRVNQNKLKCMYQNIFKFIHHVLFSDFSKR